MIYFKYIVWGGILMLCVIAKIDPKSKARFLKLQGKIEKLGISVKALHGHITLVSYIGEDEAAFIASCKEILSSCKVFPVCYDKIEVLASSCIVVASPRKEGVLEAVQRKIAEKWAKDLPDYMQADVWYPHTTLLQDMQADLGKIAQHLEENFEPFCGEVQTIEFSRVEKVGYTIVDTVELPNAYAATEKSVRYLTNLVLRPITEIRRVLPIDGQPSVLWIKK